MSFHPAENLTRVTNKPGFVGSPYNTTVCGGPVSGPLNSISCGNLTTPPPVLCARAELSASARPANTIKWDFIAFSRREQSIMPHSGGREYLRPRFRERFLV